MHFLSLAEDQFRPPGKNQSALVGAQRRWCVHDAIVALQTLSKQSMLLDAFATGHAGNVTFPPHSRASPVQQMFTFLRPLSKLGSSDAADA